jgi:DNA-binding LacI/PurR family transcriptional regulator
VGTQSVGTDDRRPASIVDVARRAGVSMSTASRALRGAANVAPRTRDRVRTAATELAYVPSPAASRLASGRTGAVGVVVPFSTRWFFAEVVAGAEAVLREEGFDLLLYNLAEESVRAEFFDVLPLRRRVDAVLVVSAALSEGERARLVGLRVPVVTVGPRVPGLARVGIDDVSGAVTAARHLLLLGHRDVTMIAGDPDDPVGGITTRARTEGFCRGLCEAGIGSCRERVVPEPWGVDGGFRAAERLLSRATLPTAVFAESDEMGFGALHALRRAGLAVPGDVSLVGFDDHEMAAVTDLTTIAQPVREQGERGARLLLELLGTASAADGAGSAAGAEIVLPTRLVVRGSTGPPGRTPARAGP